jgi:hypothetical protein
VKKINTFTVNTLKQAEQIILEAKKYKIKPTIHLKHYLLRGFGYNYVLTFKKILVSKFGKSSFKLFVDCGFDRSLGIKMAIEKIDYIKLRGNSIILKKFKFIANKNRVSLNPSFNIVDCRNLKNIKLKMQKLYLRKNK